MEPVNKTKDKFIGFKSDQGTYNLLRKLQTREKRTVSEIIRESIAVYYSQKTFVLSSEEEVKLFGKYGSKKGDISVEHDRYLQEGLNEPGDR